MVKTNSFLTMLAKQCVETTEKNEKIFLKRLSHKSPAMSSNSVLIDYLFAGGLQPKFVTFAGLPHSGKSLSSNSIIANACENGIPVFYFDAEGNISINDLEEIFGGELDTLIKDGTFNFYQDKNARIIEKVISSIEDSIQIFPTKEYVDKKGKDKEGWYYTFIHDARTEDGKKDQIKLKMLLDSDKNLKIDKELSNSDYYGRGLRDYVKIPNSKDQSGIQAIFVIDSLAALIPEKLKDEQEGGGMLLEPRLLSMYLKRICPDLERKCIMLVATNQGYCEMPTSPYSVPKYIEKGGVGIQHYRSIGFVLTERAASTAKGEKEELSPLKDRVDLYTYTEFKCVRNRINKAAENKKYYRRSWKTSNGELLGWDPFWDTKSYLELTNQYEINRGKIQLKIKAPSNITDEEIKDIDTINNTTWDYDSFKAFVLSYFVNKDEYKNLINSIKEEMKINLSPDFNFKYILDTQIKNKDFEVKTDSIDNLNTLDNSDNLGNLDKTFEDKIENI